MPIVGTIVIRTFAYTPSSVRYLYHNSLYLVGGVQPPIGQLLGILVVTIRPPSGQNPFVLYSSKVWGPRAAIAGILLPTSTVITNMFGNPAPVTIPVSIEMVIRNAPSLTQVAFTEITNLGPIPTTL